MLQGRERYGMDSFLDSNYSLIRWDDRASRIRYRIWFAWAGHHPFYIAYLKLFQLPSLDLKSTFPLSIPEDASNILLTKRNSLN